MTSLSCCSPPTSRDRAVAIGSSSTALGVGAPLNPFSVGFHAPGELDYRFAGTLGTDSLLARLRNAGGQAQIVGGPGTGKSTLLFAVGRAAAARGLEIVALRADRCREIALRLERQDGGPRLLLCLDEADVLAARELRRIRRTCRARGALLLAATHSDLGLPLAHECRVDAELAVELATRLLARSPAALPLVAPGEARSAFAQSRGDMRQALLLMYDWYEARWAAAARSR
jgi:hypothetical protein